MPPEQYDVIIVGAGSAGCAAAARLAADAPAWRICLVEAGPDYGAHGSSRWPTDLLDDRYSPSAHAWEYHERRADGSTRAAPAARVVGGGSAYNHGAAMWPPPSDYDRWAALAGPSWTYAALRPSIDRIECAAGSPSAWRGSGGALPTAAPPPAARAAWQQAFFDAALADGLAPHEDVAAPVTDDRVGCVAPLHLNVREHLRYNAAFAFLDPVRGAPCLDVRADCRAERLLFERAPSGAPRAVGVRLVGPEGRSELRCRRVLLCAGAFGTPALLLRSGVGPAEALSASGVPPVADRRGVGANLHDQPGALLTFALSAAGARAVDADRAAQKRLAAQVLAIARSPFADLPGPDLHVIPHQEPRDGTELASALLVFALAPRSRGRLSLRGPDLDTPPLIDLGLLSDPDGADLGTLAWGVGLATRLASRPPLRALWDSELSAPFPCTPGCPPLPERASAGVITYSHPAGTCRMGAASDPSAVVDGEGGVIGVEHLYVGDASIMPSVTRAGPNLTCMLIGWQVAGLVAAS